MTVRERLGPEEQARFDFQYLRANAAAKELAECHEELSLILIGQMPLDQPQLKAVTEIG
jgi:hypothetical protein